MGINADTGDYCQTQARSHCDSVRSQSGIKHGPRFQRVRVDPYQLSRSAIGYEDMAFVGNGTRRFWKAGKRSEMAASLAS
jgi:hypothetical protein